MGREDASRNGINGSFVHSCRSLRSNAFVCREAEDQEVNSAKNTCVQSKKGNMKGCVSVAKGHVLVSRKIGLNQTQQPLVYRVLFQS